MANKLIGMFLHELSRKICREWGESVKGKEYGERVRHWFGNCCPYCLRALLESTTVVEHLDGMNRHRVGLHIPGNVVVACRKCNGEKRRDDARKVLTLATSGWESFLSHNGEHCAEECPNCKYWETIWEDGAERKIRLSENIVRIRGFRAEFPLFEDTMRPLSQDLPDILAKLYSDCQEFAATEISSMLERFQIASSVGAVSDVRSD